MNIVFCVDGVYPHTIGGMQKHSKLLIETLAMEFGHNIIVIHPHSECQVFEDHLNITEIVINDINKKNNYLVECFRYSRRMYDQLVNLPNNFVIYSQGLSVWYRANYFSNRLIVNPHGLEPFQALSFKDKLIAIPFKIIFRRIFDRSLIVVSLGGRLTCILRKETSEKKIVEISNGVLLPRSRHNEKNIQNTDVIKVLFVARFSANKGIHILMQAIKELNCEGFIKKLNFVLAGSGPLFDKYKKQNTESNVEIRGFVTDDELVQLYGESDIYVLPTLFEGMPTAVLEAMAYRLPIIVSDTGATAALVDEKNGYLIKKNNVEELKNAFLAFIRLSTSDKNRMADESVCKVKEQFTWNLVAKKHKNLFIKVEKMIN